MSGRISKRILISKKMIDVGGGMKKTGSVSTIGRKGTIVRTINTSTSNNIQRENKIVVLIENPDSPLFSTLNTTGSILGDYFDINIRSNLNNLKFEFNIINPDLTKSNNKNIQKYRYVLQKYNVINNVLTIGDIKFTGDVLKENISTKISLTVEPKTFYILKLFSINFDGTISLPFPPKEFEHFWQFYLTTTKETDIIANPNSFDFSWNINNKGTISSSDAKWDAVEVVNTFIKKDKKFIYDRRVESLVNKDLHFFTTTFKFTNKNNSIKTIQTLVDSIDYTQEDALIQANKYAQYIRTLPFSLFTPNFKEIWIMKGDNPFGGGNNSILIHTQQAESLIINETIEEILMHEVCHTVLDFNFNGLVNKDKWIIASMKDDEHVSFYAKYNPLREDIAETFILYYTVKTRGTNFDDDYTSQVKNDLETKFSNRFLVFDDLNLLS